MVVTGPQVSVAVVAAGNRAVAVEVDPMAGGAVFCARIKLFPVQHPFEVDVVLGKQVFAAAEGKDQEQGQEATACDFEKVHRGFKKTCQVGEPKVSSRVFFSFFWGGWQRNAEFFSVSFASPTPIVSSLSRLG